MGYDGSRGSAHDVSDINVIVVAASNQQDISPNIINKVQGTTPGAVTAVTCAESGNNTIDTQVFLLQQLFNKQSQKQSKMPEIYTGQMLSGIVDIVRYLVTNSIRKSIYVRGTYIYDMHYNLSK
jgi:hypothetical protein